MQGREEAGADGQEGGDVLILGGEEGADRGGGDVGWWRAAD